jgi:hypothetical protein
MATETKRARARAARGLATATRVAGDKKGNGQWLWCRGWQTSDGGSNGDGDGDGTKDMAAHAMTGDRGMTTVAMGHGLCVFLCVWRDHEK